MLSARELSEHIGMYGGSSRLTTRQRESIAYTEQKSPVCYFAIFIIIIERIKEYIGANERTFHPTTMRCKLARDIRR